jgi:hypothetical protein
MPRAHTLVDQTPYRVSHLRPAAPRLPARRADSPAVPLPFSERHSSQPHTRQAVTPVAVPLSGLQPRQSKPQRDRHLSAVSWPTRASGPVSCHAAHGLLFTPSRVFPSRKASTPLGATCSLADPPTATRPAMLASLSPAVSPTPALARACLVPRPTKGSLSRRLASRPTFPVTLGHEHRDQLGSQPSSAAKLSPPASPFAPALGLPTASGRYSPGLLAPLRPSPLAPRSLGPA